MTPTQQKPAPAVGPAKPTKVEVGQRWSSMNVEVVVEAPYQQSMGTWWMRFPTGRFPWSTEGILSLTYLGPLPGKAGEEGHWEMSAIQNRPDQGWITCHGCKGPETCSIELKGLGRHRFVPVAPPTLASRGVKAEGVTSRERPAPIREVGAGPNGPWLPYDSLVDSDPFTSYRHRRENGAVVATEAGGGVCDFSDPYAVVVSQSPTKFVTQVCCHCGESSPPEPFNCKPKDWRAYNEGLDRQLTDALTSAANPVTAPPSPIDPTPGAGIPERRAYRTPSGGVK